MKTSKTLVLDLLCSLLALSSIAAGDDSENACVVDSCMGSFDLTPLRAPSDYKFTHNHQNFTLNVCRGVVSELWNPKTEHTETVGAFIRGPHGDLSIGEVNTTFHVRNGHPMLYLLNGSPCPQSDSSSLSSTAISFICDKSIDLGSPELIAELPEEGDNACSYFVEWRTKYACAIPPSKSGWKVLLTVVVIVLSLLVALLALLFLQRRISRRREEQGLPDLDHSSGGRPWYTPTGATERLHDFGRLMTGQDPWGDADVDHPQQQYQSMNGHGRGGDRQGSGWGTKFSSLRLFGSRKSDAARGGRNGFARLPRSLEEESMLRNGGDDGGRFSLDDDDNEADITAGAGGATPPLNEESAAWGAATRPRALSGNGMIRL